MQRVYAFILKTQGRLHRVDDLLRGRSTTYKYNASGKLVNVTVSDSLDDRVAFGENLFYNENGQPSSVFLHKDYCRCSSHVTQY